MAQHVVVPLICILFTLQNPSFSSLTPPPPPTSAPHALASLPNGPVANGTDMQAQGSTSMFVQRDPSPQHPLDSRGNEMETGLVEGEGKPGRREGGREGGVCLWVQFPKVIAPFTQIAPYCAHNHNRAFLKLIMCV